MSKYLTNFQIKIIAIITMTIDHIGAFGGIFPFRVIGRIAFPLFAFLISEGALHTKNIKKYFSRLFIFSLIIEILFQLSKIFYDNNSIFNRNIFFTLSIGLLLIIVYRSNYKFRIVYIELILLASFLFNFDYGVYGALLILMFYVFKGKNLVISLGFLGLNILYCYIYDNTTQMYSLLALPIIFLYNGLKGRNIKYLFYLYYPLHLIVLYLIYNYI